jgi:Kef-type K+ transport system membrane component KefB
VLPSLLLALAAVVVVGRVLGALFRRAGQPPVIGEVVGGILLGPSFLGLISPAAYRFILPPEIAPLLGVVAQIGVIIYMFLIGLELNPELLRSRAKPTIAISVSSIVLPFGLGLGLSIYLYESFAPSNVSYAPFALFLGLSMSITAFPVLARILTDIGLTRTPLGTIALTCAAFEDVAAWCLLAFVTGFVQSAAGSAVVVAVLTAGFAAVMFAVVRPLAARLVAGLEERSPTQGTVAIVLVGLLMSAWTTEVIGIHAVFGAFIFGVVIPHQSNLAKVLHQNLESLTILLLPAFFAFTGMRTEIGLLGGPYEWAVCAIIIALATVGKWGGAVFGARLTGLSWRDASALGVLVNTRGLMELIVLNVGYELGVISQTLFTMMVLMAIVTTVATTPLLRRILDLPKILWTKPA